MSNLQAQIILEILGRPPENVKDALTLLLSKLDAEKGVKVLEKNVHDPIPVKDSKDLYTAFAEATLELDSIEHYFAVLFAYMPSHIELIYPEKIILENSHLNQIASQLVQRLHNYDAVAKNIVIERDILLKKLKEVAPHLFSKTKVKKEESPAIEEKPKKPKKSSKKKNKS